MLVKTLNRGTGKCSAAVNYLMQEKDSNGEVRAEIDVLRGNPHLVATVSENLTSKHKYKSMVLAFHPEDKPTKSQIEDLLNDFEKVAFTGIEPCWTAVQHKEQNGQIHIHVVMATTDLNSGKSYNPVPPGWEKKFRALKDFHNEKNKWKNPNEQTRFTGFENHRSPNFEEKKQVYDFIQQSFIFGEIDTREDVIDLLKDYGEITKITKKNISFIPQGQSKPMRLEGGLIDERLQRDNSRERERSGEIPERNTRELRKKLDQQIGKLEQFNLKTYGTSKEANKLFVDSAFNNNANMLLDNLDSLRNRKLADEKNNREQQQVGDHQERVKPTPANNATGFESRNNTLLDSRPRPEQDTNSKAREEQKRNFFLAELEKEKKKSENIKNESEFKKEKNKFMNNYTYQAIERQMQGMGVKQLEIEILNHDRTERVKNLILTQDNLAKNLPYLKAKNTEGCHIFCRPAEQDKAVVLVDDLDEVMIDKLKASGLQPSCTVETSNKNFQAWVNFGDEKLTISQKKYLADQLAELSGGDKAGNKFNQLGRLAGFTNRKDEHITPDKGYPFVYCRNSNGQKCTSADQFINLAKMQKEEIKIEVKNINPDRNVREGLYSQYSSEMIARTGETDISKIDYAIASRLLSVGTTEEQVAGILTQRPDLQTKKGSHAEEYINRTIDNARNALERKKVINKTNNQQDELTMEI